MLLLGVDFHRSWLTQRLDLGLPWLRIEAVPKGPDSYIILHPHLFCLWDSWDSSDVVDSRLAWIPLGIG